MKKILLFTLSQMFIISAFCQPELKTELLTDVDFVDIDLSDEWLDIPIYVLLENSGTEPASIRWQYYEQDPENCIGGWETYGCDNNNCYGTDVISNVNPMGGGPNNPSIIEPGESYEFSFHVRPKQTKGCCTINLDFSYTATPDDIFSSIELPIKLNDPECENISTSTEDLETEEINIYPTITEDVINIECNVDRYHSINVLSTNGALIKNLKINNATTSISLADYNSGPLFIELIGEGASSIHRVFLRR